MNDQSGKIQDFWPLTAACKQWQRSWSSLRKLQSRKAVSAGCSNSRSKISNVEGGSGGWNEEEKKVPMHVEASSGKKRAGESKVGGRGGGLKVRKRRAVSCRLQSGANRVFAHLCARSPLSSRLVPSRLVFVTARGGEAGHKGEGRRGKRRRSAEGRERQTRREEEKRKADGDQPGLGKVFFLVVRVRGGRSRYLGSTGPAGAGESGRVRLGGQGRVQVQVAAAAAEVEVPHHGGW